MPFGKAVRAARPVKSDTAIQAPSGRPISAPRVTAPRLAWNESQRMASTFGSRWARSETASIKVPSMD
jgi:hypothetical protein